MRTSGRKNPVLAELILVILFFSLSSTVLVRIFVKAGTISGFSRAETLGLVLAQDWTEQWKGKPENPYTVFAEEKGWEKAVSTEPGQLFRAWADENMELKPVEDKTGVYEIKARFLREEKEAGILYRIRITIVQDRNGRTIADLETASYVSGEEGAM